MLREERGFSLQELMVIIGIIALLCAMALPAVIGWVPKYKVGSAAREVLAAMELARHAAVKRNAATSVEFDYTQDLLRVSAAGETVRTVRMPSGIDLREPAQGSLGAAVLFNNQGIPNKAGRVVIGRNGGADLERSVRLGAGGTVRIE
ncbi:MAG: GspH/FimT family pseudopilin [Desulfobacterales bacterium]